MPPRWDAPLPSTGWTDSVAEGGGLVPSNLGVNPALTITALAEHVMTGVAAKGQERGEEERAPAKVARAAEAPVSAPRRWWRAGPSR
jgi:hypothetical protein